MKRTATVTQKGQITIPKELRDKFGIELYGTVEVIPEKDGIKVKPTEDILDLGGKLRVWARKNKGVDPLKAREYMETHYKRV